MDIFDINLIKVIGGFDAVVIAALGSYGAFMVLSGKENKFFTDRLLPACGILIGTSIAAGIIMAIARWLGG